MSWVFDETFLGKLTGLLTFLDWLRDLGFGFVIWLRSLATDGRFRWRSCSNRAPFFLDLTLVADLILGIGPIFCASFIFSWLLLSA